MKTGKNLVELATEIQRRAESKRDLVTGTQNIKMVETGLGRVALELPGNEQFGLNSVAHGQIGEQEKFQQQIKNNDLFTCRQFEHVSILCGWVREFDGTISFFRTCSPPTSTAGSRSSRPSGWSVRSMARPGRS